MRDRNGYIMREQVRGVVLSIMSYDVTRRGRSWEESLPFFAIAAVTMVYLCAMAFSG